MKFFLVIAGVLAVLVIAKAQEAENDNQDEAIEVPNEPEQDPDQEENENQIPELPQEKPHGRPHLRPPRPHFRLPGPQQPGQQNQGENPRRGPFGRHPRPHRHPLFRPQPQQPRPEPQPEEQPNEDDSVIDEAESVLLNRNDFSILNGSGNDNIIINQGDDDDYEYVGSK